MFVAVSYFHPSLIIASNVGSTLSGAPNRVSHPALFLGWKSFIETNPLAYYIAAFITAMSHLPQSNICQPQIEQTPSLVFKYQTRVEMADSKKYTSSQYGISCRIFDSSSNPALSYQSFWSIHPSPTLTTWSHKSILLSWFPPHLYFRIH